MGQFDEIYNNLMESMTIGGVTGVVSTPPSGPDVGSTAGQLGSNSKGYNDGDNRYPFGKVTVQRRNLKFNSNRKRRKSK